MNWPPMGDMLSCYCGERYVSWRPHECWYTREVAKETLRLYAKDSAPLAVPELPAPNCPRPDGDSGDLPPVR